MQKTILSIALLSQTLFGFSNEQEVKVKSNIKNVTVFLSGAEVTSQGGSALPAGASELVFEGLSPDINANSIQAKGEGDFIILGVLFRQNYLNQQPKSREIIVLEDSLELLQVKLEALRNQRSVYESEENFLLANINIGGSNVGVSSIELEKIANILRTRLMDLKSKQLEIKGSEKKINETVSRINGQLQQHNANRNRYTGEIVISVTSKSGGNAKLDVTYMVNNAGWVPYYDIRAVDAKSPVQLMCRANVFQNTGVDWKNVKLSLSTGNPSISGTQPILSPWWLNFQQYYSYDNQDKKSTRGARSEAYPAAAPAAKAEEAYFEGEVTVMESAADYTTVVENTTNYEYDISIPYTIVSGGKQTSVEIQSYNVPATYKYYCAPRLDKDAFLLAKVVDWDQYNLMPGDANVYFEGTFVGKSYLNPLSTNDTLDISLGRDKNIVVTRNLLKELCERKVVATNKKESFIYEISVRNKKKSDIEIIIEDIVPLSRNSEIEVEVLETSSAKFDKDQGKLTWEMKIAPAENKKMKFGYSVKYPKDKVISNL